jgi:capsular polysaccharide biosynthesis protein
MYEVLARIALSRGLLSKGSHVYVSTRFAQYLEALDYLGIPREQVVSSSDNCLVFGHEVHVPIYSFHSGMQLLDIMVDLCRELKQKALETSRVKSAPRKIFLSRKGYSSLFNEEELLPFIEAQGFEVVYPQQHSLADQVAIFDKAEVVLGAVGSAMSNLMFCRPGTKVIELRPAANTSHRQAVSLAFGLRLCVVKANFGNRFRGSGNPRYQVDRDALLTALRQE